MEWSGWSEVSGGGGWSGVEWMVSEVDGVVDGGVE